MADPNPVTDPASPAVDPPTHYAVRLNRPYQIPGTTVTVPAGDSTVAAEIVEAMPAEIVLNKVPAAA